MRSLCLLLLVAPLFGAVAPERAFEILERNCASCHGAQVTLSGLSLASHDAALKGGKRGPAIVPGKSSDSLLYQAVAHTGKVAMPPAGKLPDADIAVLKEWIDSGALWPAAGKTVTTKWWSFQPVKSITPPALKSEWVRTPVDAFILDTLHRKQLEPSKEASRPALIRRLTFDLHGLPPTAAETKSFVEDTSPDAYEKLVDRLLASPRYGEQWGKHWLDLVRYGDTAGFEQDPYLLLAWRYRDFVIDSLNADKSYDQFIKEQIAGDEIYEDPAQKQGTGYFTVGANRDMLFKVEDINRVETMTDFVDTTSAVFLGLSVGCARCHDHKYDPIPQRDYYRMQAIFAPAVKTRVFLQYDPARGYDLAENNRQFKLYDIAAEISSVRAPYRAKIRAANLAKLPQDVQDAFAAPEEHRTPQQKTFFEMYTKKVAPKDDAVLPLMSPANLDRLHKAEKRLLALYNDYAPGPFAPGLTDAENSAPRTFIPGRGGGLGEEVKPGTLSCIGGSDIADAPPDSLTTHRRKALAEWLASPNNPLTARVMVNRVWQYHFGRGIVASTSDFGARGTPPTHPELLDYLASQFMKEGWSLKKLHRMILTSSVYRESSSPRPEAIEKDPENQWLSHFTRRRLEAEEVRDAVLQSSGTLNLKMHGRPVVPELSAEELYGMSQPVANAWPLTTDRTEYDRRSIYMLSRRNFRMPMLEVFDRPEGVLTCPRRESSTTAPQSLTLLNGPFTMKQAKALAAKAKSVDALWLQVFSSPPDADELKMANTFFEKQKQLSGSAESALAELARALLNTNEFLYVD